MKKKKVIVSTDCGLSNLIPRDPDDILALIHLFEQEDIEVTAILTTYGNMDEESVYQSAIAFLKTTGFSTNIYHGAKKKGDINTDVQDYLNQIDPSEYILLSIGPLTNLINKSLVKFHQVIIMGGAFKTKGSVLLSPIPFKTEFNIACDINAAAHVFSTRAISVVPLDLTSQIYLSHSVISKISTRWPKIGNKFQLWEVVNRLMGKKGQNPHDLIAALVVTNYDLFNATESGIKIELGQTIESIDSTIKHKILSVKDIQEINKVIDSVVIN